MLTVFNIVWATSNRVKLRDMGPWLLPFLSPRSEKWSLFQTKILLLHRQRTGDRGLCSEDLLLLGNWNIKIKGIKTRKSKDKFEKIFSHICPRCQLSLQAFSFDFWNEPPALAGMRTPGCNLRVQCCLSSLLRYEGCWEAPKAKTQKPWVSEEVRRNPIFLINPSPAWPVASKYSQQLWY